MEDQLTSNVIRLVGTVESEISVSHELYGEKFCLFRLAVQRLSAKADFIQVTVSERLLDNLMLTLGARVLINGQLRSYNKQEDGRNRLILTVFAREISLCQDTCPDPNQIELEGFVCKKPTYRTTPFGREITDLLVAVNRLYNKSDYIPVIAWGRNARYAGNLSIGEKIRITGRFQSREYQKNFSETDTQTRIAYEVSVSSLESLEGAGEKTRVSFPEAQLTS